MVLGTVKFSSVNLKNKKPGKARSIRCPHLYKAKQYVFLASVPIKFFPIFNLSPLGGGITVFPFNLAVSSTAGDNFRSVLAISEPCDKLVVHEQPLWNNKYRIAETVGYTIYGMESGVIDPSVSTE